MRKLARWKQQYPVINVVLVSTDPIELLDEAVAVINNYNLAAVDNWIFSSGQTEKLRYFVDPQWYGELPRSYLFDSAHRATAHSGVLTQNQFDRWLQRNYSPLLISGAEW